MQDAAAALRYSDAYFCKLFKQCFKVNFSAYLNEYRVNRARQLILDPRLSLKDIALLWVTATPTILQGCSSA